MLLATGGSVPTSARFTYSDDYKGSSSDEHRIYENIEVYLFGEDEDSVTLNGYSETAYPSLNQLQVYVGELNTDDGVESLKSSTESLINTFYSTCTTRYNDELFIQYLLYTTLDVNVVYTDASISADMVSTYWTIVKNNLDSYTEFKADELNTYYGWWDVFDNPTDYLANPDTFFTTES